MVNQGRGRKSTNVKNTRKKDVSKKTRARGNQKSKSNSRAGGSKMKGKEFEMKAFTDIWQDFSNKMNNHFAEILKENQAEYDKLYGTWTNLSSKFGTQMTSNLESSNKELSELYNVWKNYATKLSTRLTRIGNNGGIDYDILLENWKSYSDKLNKELFGNGGKGNIQTIYVLWDDIYKDMTKQMNEMIQSGTTINEDLTSTWNDFTNNMDHIITDLTGDSAYKKELDKHWKNLSVQLNKGITDFVKTYEGDYTKLYTMWSKQSERVGETLSDTLELLTESYGDIYNKYFTRTAPYFKNLYSHSETRVKKLENEIKDLKSRLEKIEKKSRRK
jgi:hypothetical protein